MALAQEVIRTGRGVAGSAFWSGGMNSSDDPMFIGDRQYVQALNITNRGGYTQSRPGYRALFDLPAGNLQGMAYFRPIKSPVFLVFAVDGLVYSSRYPFTSYSQIPGIKFFKGAKDVFWCGAVKSVEQADDGTLSIIDPKKVLMMQDGGYSRAAYWDGSTGRHLNPEPEPSVPCACATTGNLNLEDVPAVIDTYPLAVGDRVLVRAQTDTTQNGVYTYQTGTPARLWKGIRTPGLPPVPTNLGYLVRADDANTTKSLAAGTFFFVSQGKDNFETSWTVTTAPTIIGITPVLFTQRKTQSQYNETPMGGVMIWSCDRLWLAIGNKFLASDINDPLKFTETTYASEGGAFFVEEDVTGFAEVQSGTTTPQLIVFTRNTTSAIQASIRDRSLWKATRGFQSMLFHTVGCCSHRSICHQQGLLWWMSNFGVTNFNVAAQSFITSPMAAVDIEMAVSKGGLSPNIDRVASASYDNYILFSLPSGSKYNRHTWVRDAAQLGSEPPAAPGSWDGIWTGTFPVEWDSGPVNGVERIFHVSRDADGHNRLWEAFTADRKDNGLSITSYVETKAHLDFSQLATGLDLKRFVCAEVTFDQMYGDVSAAVYWAGLRGVYKKIGEYNFSATEGSLKTGTQVKMTDLIEGYRPQSRRVRTPTVSETNTNISPDSSMKVESTWSDVVDVGFSLLIVWSGRACLRSYRIWADPQQESSTGSKEHDESGETRVVTDQMSPGSFKG